MLRRRVCSGSVVSSCVLSAFSHTSVHGVPFATATPLGGPRVSVRASSSNEGSGSRGNGNRRPIQMHRFIRDNPVPGRRGTSAAAAAAAGASGGSSSSSSTASNQKSLHFGNPSSNAEGYVNVAGGGTLAGGRYRGSGTTGGGGGGGSSASFTPTGPRTDTDTWAARLQMELLRDVDPLGGMAHKDVYRDPALGYTPAYAPRDFVSGGGSIAYFHPRMTTGSSSSLMGSATDAFGSSHFHHATSSREWKSQERQEWNRSAQEARGAMRSLANATERAAFLSNALPAASGDRTAAGGFKRGESASLHPVDVMRSETLGRQGRRPHIPSRDAIPAPASSNRETSGPPGVQTSHSVGSARTPLHSPFSAEELAERYQKQDSDRFDDSLAEHLHIVKGGRARERFDFSVLQRSSRMQFQGYDHDRWNAQRNATPHGAQRLPAMVAPSPMTEAQKQLRDAAGLPLDVSTAQRVFAENTSNNTPQLGESLTETALDAIAAEKQQAEQRADKQRTERFGLGRRGAPLVQDGGPDKRHMERGKNDQRLVDALAFGSDAYRLSATDEHTNPYMRRDTQRGVGHLLTNAFDIQRRDDRISKGKDDLTEQNMQHLGTPIQQQVDEFVLRHRNARGERPLDYFKPFPHFRAQRLYRVYEDTAGFSLMRQRPEFLEWELFVRYRAHHEQRRELALRHGLEPVANETASERDARRLRLDILCEQTPFDPSRIPGELEDDAQRVSVEELRAWFGVFLLPSPTIVKKVMDEAAESDAVPSAPLLQHLEDELGTLDTREHLLSQRYLNQLALLDAYQFRQQRGFVKDVVHSAPEPVIKYAQPEERLRYFDEEERKMYQEYVAQENARQLQEWEKIKEKRRFVPQKGQFATVMEEGPATKVMDLQHVETGQVLTVAVESGAMQLVVKPIVNAKETENGGSSHSNLNGKESPSSTHNSSNNNSNNNNNTNSATSGAATTAMVTVAAGSPGVASGPLVQVDNQVYQPILSTHRSVRPLRIRLESTGEEMHCTSEVWETYPLEVAASTRYNHALDFGIREYHYNRNNYIETQDVLWEQHTAAGEEGWSPATHADGLCEGLVVRARRPPVLQVSTSSTSSASSPLLLATPMNPTADNSTEEKSETETPEKRAEVVVVVRDKEEEEDATGTGLLSTFSSHLMLTGEYERATIVSYLKQPFYNPDPRTVTVQFSHDRQVLEVPLADILIWQRRYFGPERTVANTTRRYNPAGLQRYVNVLDPDGTATRGKTQGETAHFLDKYVKHQPEAVAKAYRSTKQITELDQWSAFDTRRADNYRPLSISHRRDYIRQGYMPRYTPWEWITVQEADQPILHHTMRQDHLGPSFFFQLRRHWRHKARPHGYLRHFDNEVRDLLQFVDGVTPWKQAQKLRTYWEVREHHPMPQFNRPEVAMHRNTAALLPSHMWETDKKTGKVKGVKDSVRDYRTTTPLPKWVKL